MSIVPCNTATCQTLRSWCCRIAPRYLFVLLGLCAALAGCGTSRPSVRFGEHSVKYVPNGVRILARERLPAGAYFAIAALRYEFMGHTSSRLGLRYESQSERGFAGDPGWSGGPSLEPMRDESQPLTMNISRSCSDSYAPAPAYGVLRDPQDTVASQEHGVTTVFRRVAIPANFRTNGVLVYTLLGRGPADIVTRTPSGRIASNEPYAPDSAVCG
jgi:hypothetical protein